MTNQAPTQSLLDLGELPIADIARIAMREGVRPRAAYQAHKWFARRLAITARSLLVAAATPSGQSFWRAFYRGDLWQGRKVLDPFVGGGVMLLEARRLGADVVGVDVEPVAAAIARFQTTLRDLPDLKAPLQELIDSVGNQLAPYYQTTNAEGEAETLVHAFWVQQVRCGQCRTVFDAHPMFRFAWDDKRQWVACSGCSNVLQRAQGDNALACTCGSRTRPDEGHGADGSATCPQCGATEKLIDYARRTRRRPSFRLFAVETLPGKEKGRVVLPQRCIRSSTQADQNRFKAARKALRALLKKEPDALPRGHIPRIGRSDDRLIDYGYTDYQQMFNARQKLHLALLGAAIQRMEGPAREAMAIAFSDHLTTNNMQCAYAGGWRRLTPLFSIRAYRHIARPVELNPWLRYNGRGTFPNAVRSVTRAGDALKTPQEPTSKNLFRPVLDSAPGDSDIQCRDATRLTHLERDSVDLVLTDPPYFDYISYSELGHFFTPWLSRLGVIAKRRSPGFPRGQLASSTRSSVAEKRFTSGLTRAFKEIRRVSKDDGRIVFTYQNLDGLGWSALAGALARAGVIPIRTFPMFGDSSASLHKHNLSISWDCVMVCVPGDPVHRFSLSDDDRDQGKREANRWKMALEKKGHVLSEGDLINISYAHSITHGFTRRQWLKESARTTKKI